MRQKRIGIFGKTILFLVFLFIGLKLIQPPLLNSLLMIYMTLAVISVLLYVSANPQRLQVWLTPLKILVFEDRAKIPRMILAVLVPLLFSYIVYSKGTPDLEPPANLRIVHPAPPSEIEFKGKRMILAEVENPFRVKDPEKLKQYTQEGKTVYYQNCFYCHGDNLDGKGHFAKGFNPLPANFADAGTIAQLQESYVFWRVSKGGPGLPANAQPWNSAMPVWENFLSEDEIWKSILWIYEGSGRSPRTWEEKAGQ